MTDLLALRHVAGPPSGSSGIRPGVRQVTWKRVAYVAAAVALAGMVLLGVGMILSAQATQQEFNCFQSLNPPACAHTTSDSVNESIVAQEGIGAGMGMAGAGFGLTGIGMVFAATAPLRNGAR